MTTTVEPLRRADVASRVGHWTRIGVRGCARHRERLALGLPPLVAALATWRWFPFDRFLAAGDVTPFVRTGMTSELTSFWNHQTNGAGATSPVINHTLEVILIRAVGVVGGSETLAQHLLYALLMGYVAFGAAYLARSFVEQPLVVGAAGLLGAFNPFVLVRLPNPLPLLWLGLVATLAGTIVRTARGMPRSRLGFAAATLPASYLALNLPLLATAALAVATVIVGCSALVGPGGTRRAARFAASVIPYVVGFNLWWLVPVALASFAPQGLTIAAQTRVEDWSWSHALNSIANVTTLTADWGWHFPEYLPYAHTLDSAPWSWLRWILPALALAAPFVAHGRRRVTATTLLGIGTVTAFLAKGLHPPLDSWNLWFYHHIPGMWLLREPVSKVGGLLVLVEVILAAMTLTGLLAQVRRRSPQYQRLGGGLLGTGVVLALAFPLPLWIGGFGPDGRHGLPSAHVAVPAQWRALARVINDSPTTGRVLQLPLDPYYQVTTTWGYHGADELARGLLRRPVLQLLPSGYYSPSWDLAELLHSTENALSTGNVNQATTLLHLLGVSRVIVRRDLTASQVIRPATNPAALIEGLTRLPQVEPPQHFGVADLYTIEPSSQLAWIPKSVTGLVRRDPERLADAIAELPVDNAAVAPGTTPIDTLSWEAPDTPTSRVRFTLRNDGIYDIGLQDPLPSQWRARLDAVGPTSRLEFVDPIEVTLDSTPLVRAPTMVVPIEGSSVDAVDLGGQLVALHPDPTDLMIDRSVPVRALAGTPVPAPLPSKPAAQVCGPQPAHVASPFAKSIPRGVELHAAGGVACTTIDMPALSPENAYLLHLGVRNISGNTDRLVCVWEEGPNRCASLIQPLVTRRWTAADVAVRTDPGTTKLTLFLYAEAHAGSTRGIVQYRDVALTPLRTVGVGELSPTPRPQASLALDQGSHLLRVVGNATSRALRLDTTLGDCNRSDARTAREAGLDVRPIPDGVELTAAAHTACVTAPLPDTVTGIPYVLSLDARTLRGASARLCIWENGPNHCASTQTLPATSDWAHHRLRFTLDSGTSSTLLFLYADGSSHPVTLTQYRHITFKRLEPEIVGITPRSSTPPRSAVSWYQASPDRFEVHVSGTGRSELLVLDESYAPSWNLDGASTHAHVMANGYANAWVVDTGNGRLLQARYGPSQITRLAILVSGVVIVTAVALTLLRRSPYRRHDSGPQAAIALDAPSRPIPTSEPDR